MEEIDIWRTAGTLIKSHGGEQATLTAAMRADALLDHGDVEGFKVWKRIATAISELERVRPLAGEALN